MNITVSPDGWVQIENGTIEDAVALIRAWGGKAGSTERTNAQSLRDVINDWNQKVADPDDQPTKVGAEREMKPLSPALAEVHEYLVDNDRPEGFSPTDLADAFDTKRSSMDQRLRQMALRGFVKKISRGQYRVIS